MTEARRLEIVDPGEPHVAAWAGTPALPTPRPARVLRLAFPALRATRVPRSVRAAARAVVAARGRPERLERVFRRTTIPIVMVDDDRRYVDANPAARLLFRLTLEELRARRVDDLTPERARPGMKAAWTRLKKKGSAAGVHTVAAADGAEFDIAYYARASVAPRLHVGAFAPAGWGESELGGAAEDPLATEASRLTPRELDVLQLAADGRPGPRIAEELVVSKRTVKTHFEHVYAKLGVSSRAAAVAKAMRLGLID